MKGDWLMKHTRLLTFILVLQLLTFFGRWVDWSYVTPAYAQGTSDAGSQRQQLIEQQKETNQKLDKLISLLESGKLQVTVAEESKKK
jgi:hypothetical protein